MPGVHAILTTCTIPGIEVPDEFLAADKTIRAEHWLQTLVPRVTAEANMVWVTRFELRPGHLNPFVSVLRAEMKKALPSVKYQLAKIFGQYDLRIQCQDNSHAEWLRFVIAVALPLATREGSLVRAMETLPQIKVEDDLTDLVFSEGDSSASIVSPHDPPSEKLQKEMGVIEYRCGKSGVAPHTIEVLCATRSRLASLSDDDLLRGTFRSVERIFESFADGLSRLPIDQPPPLNERHLSQWLYCVERCLADRYRGTYPIGDALVPRLGSYQASHHGFLQASDVLAQSACDLAIEEMKRQLGEAPHGSTEHSSEPTTLPKIAICCQIGNSPSPNAISLIEPMRCGFIELPAAMIFQMRDMASLLHEVGHVVANTFFCHYPDLLGADHNPQANKEVAEILAEAFSRSLCFGGNADLHASCMEKILETYLPDQSNRLTQSTNLVYFTRLTAVNWLVEQRWSQGDSGRQVEQAFFTHIWEQLRRDIPVVEEHVVVAKLHEIADALSRLARLYDEQTPFHAYLDAMRTLADTDKLKDRPNGTIIVRFREFISAKESPVGPPASLADDFRMLEEMCAMRSAVGAKFAGN